MPCAHFQWQSQPKPDSDHQCQSPSHASACAVCNFAGKAEAVLSKTSVTVTMVMFCLAHPIGSPGLHSHRWFQRVGLALPSSARMCGLMSRSTQTPFALAPWLAPRRHRSRRVPVASAGLTRLEVCQWRCPKLPLSGRALSTTSRFAAMVCGKMRLVHTENSSCQDSRL